jgi:spore coat protein SA
MPATSLLKVGVLLSGREQFGPYYGGALARWTYEVYSRLRDSIDVTVFGYPTAAGQIYNLPHRTSSAWRLCNLISQIPGARRYEEQLWLRAFAQSFRQFDIIHIHNRPQWVAKLRNQGFHGEIWLHLQNNHLGHWTTPMLDALAPKLDGVAVCSTYLRDTFAPRCPAIAAKAKVIFNGVDTHLFHPEESLREPKTIFFVGRFDPEKGVLQLVRAFEQLLPRHPDAKLIIGGTTGFGVHQETPYVRQVRELAQSLQQTKNANITFPGYIHHDHDLPAYFQRATIFACPSLFQEPFGLVNAEAMACGTPVAGSNRGGIPEALGSAGIVANPENTEEFAAALSRLLDNPQLRTQLGAASLSRSREVFDWAAIAQTWLETLRSTAARNKSQK